MISDYDELVKHDLNVVWHPCTQMKDHEWLPMIPIRRGDGVWLEDYAGRRYLDAISSWWVNLFGHGHPDIRAAISRQAEQLDHVLLAGMTHKPAVDLARRLTQLAPEGLSRCFYADNGSSAVEVALKMSFHYWRKKQPSRQRFVCLENAYHGETLGALSVSQLPLYKRIYQPLLLDTLTVPSPDCFGLPAAEWEAHARAMFEPAQRLLSEHRDEICAVIIEPLVQCAGGMRMYHPVYLSLLRQLCSELGIHLIADEIAVGFGRTGTLFACEQARITPDIMCLSKGITGGVLPLAAVLVGEPIYDAFYEDYEKQGAFLHSHSYTGNPIACAAALATLDIFEQKDVIAANRELARRMGAGMEDLRAHPRVSDVRQQGMILAVELAADGPARQPFPSSQRRGLRVYQHGLENGVLLRPLGDVIYFMPPYVITPEQIDRLVEVAHAGLEAATRD